MDTSIFCAEAEAYTQFTLLALSVLKKQCLIFSFGPYPWPLKQRIQSRTGHLSNEASGKLLKILKHDGFQYVVLAHLSKTNNTPQKAIQEIGSVLVDCKPQIHVATQNECADCNGNSRWMCRRLGRCPFRGGKEINRQLRKA